MVSVIIPVRNGGEDLRRCLDALARQVLDEPFELIVVDSSSTDGSAELALAHGARLTVIPASAFNHGGTRNLAAEGAQGDILVFTSQDAYAERDDWLARLVGPLRADPSLAGVYGRQVAHEGAHPPERFFMDFLYGPGARLQRADGRGELSMRTTLFSNANAAIRRELWARYPFAADIIMSEDQEWSARVLVDGWALRYEPEASVRHSHPYTLRAAFRRFFDSGVSAERAYLSGARPSARTLRQEALRYAREEIAWLWRTGHRRWLPYAAVYELTKFAGLQLGARHRMLPLALKLRMSALPSYWTH